MATPVGTILCVGMLSFASIILVAAMLASAFIDVPADDQVELTTGLRVPESPPAIERAYSTAI
jgi:hypothetical protein